MIKEALEYIVGLRKPNMVALDGATFSDKDLRRVSFNPKADAIRLNTLSSLVEYIKAFRDEMEDRMIVHVTSPTKVRLFSGLDYERKRECMAEAEALLPRISFDSYIDHEAFCIGLQAKFVESADRALLLKFAGTVEAGTIAEYGDNGVTQKATIKTGIASKSDAIVPNPVNLMPYRTFLEVDQPMSAFVFRMKGKGEDDISCALFEADGGAWKNDAMKNVARYLAVELAGTDGITVIC